MRKIQVSTGHELKCVFNDYGILFRPWGTEGTTKPFEKFWGNMQGGELELYSTGDRLLFETHRAQTIILAEIDGTLSMLFEEKTFHNGLVVPTSREYSTREKGKFVQGETALQACVRGLAEELQQFDVDSNTLTFLSEEEGKQHESRSYPGLLSRTCKTTFLWRMPRKRVKKKFVERCDYCVNRFTWDSVPPKIIQMCKPHLKKAA